MSIHCRSALVVFALAAWGLAPAPSLGAAYCDPNQPLSGATLFAENCASCHGADATGGKTPKGVTAPDLTALKSKGHGQFPAPRVADVIRYGGALPDHGGGGQMPVWARIFSAECGPVYSRRVVVELMKYVESQQK